MAERCIDASIAIKWVLNGERWQQKARLFLRDSLAAGYRLIAPPLFMYETESVIQWRLFSGQLSLADADVALKRLETIRVEIETDARMVVRAREIARTFGQERVYDSVYAALAELRGCEFWTADRRFYDAVSSDLTYVNLLSDYT